MNDPAPPPTESVWDYPRPPRLERVSLPIQVELGEVVLAFTMSAYRVLETSHPPTYYIPPSDVATQYLHQTRKRTFCEWKGAATYFDVEVRDVIRHNAAWCYPKPNPGFEAIAGMLTFYASMMDRCWVGSEIATPQAGDFYGGWITSWISGPFKGSPGTSGW